MAGEEGEERRRKPRGKRAPRADSGERVVFRVTAEEKRFLLREAGELGISSYVRARLFGGGVRNRDGLRRIAALHVLGRQVQRLADKPEVDEFVIANTLGDVCAAIRGLADELDGFAGDGEASS